MILRDYLLNVYSDHEIGCINDKWLSQEVTIEKVSDIYSFLSQCELESVTFKKAGPQRKDDWETGWSGHGITTEYPDFPDLPYYFKKNTHVRIGENVYQDLSGLTELYLLRTIQDVAFSSKLIDRANAIIEYGCGTGHNLRYLASRFPHQLYGADWAKSAVERIVESKVVKSGRAFQVDYFDKNTYKGPQEPFIAFTNASLEQSGENYHDFLNFLFSNNQCVGGIHIEPISDLVSPTHDLNKFSIRYAKRRAYLTNFYHYMKASEIKILCAKDFGLGSKFISGYQLLIWEK